MPTTVLFVGFCDVDCIGFRRLADGTEFQLEFMALDCESALKRLANARIDVVVIDAHSPGISLMKCVESIAATLRDQAILLFVQQEHPSILARVACLGVLGVIQGTDGGSNILDRIRRAAQGDSSWTREDLRRLSLSGASIPAAEGYPVPLTHREKEILALVVEGGTNKQIAQGLGISYETVKEHIQHILQKIGVNDRSQAAVWAVHHAMV